MSAIIPPPICATRKINPDKAKTCTSEKALKTYRKVSSLVPSPITVIGSIFSKPAMATPPETVKKEIGRSIPKAKK